MTLILAPCPCIYHEDEGGGEREVGRGLEPRLIGDDREASIISGSFLDLFFILPLIRIPEYSVPELVGRCGDGVGARFFLLLLLLPRRYVTAGNETIVWNVFSLQCEFYSLILARSVSVSSLPLEERAPSTPRHPIIHPVMVSPLAQVITSRWFTRNLSARFFPREKKFYQYVRRGRRGGMPAFSTEYGGTRLLSETALHSHYAKNAFIAPSRRIYRAPLPCYALRSCVIKGIFGVGSCPLTRK